MKLIAKTNFNLDDIFYEKGDEVNVKSKETLVKLNEKGFINPLTPKEIQNFSKDTLDLKNDIVNKEVKNARENTRKYRED